MINDKNIVKEPDERLRMVSEEVRLPLSKEDETILNEMYTYLKEHQNWVGLAAIQVGVLKRMCVLRYKDKTGKTQAFKLVNPKIVSHSQEMQYRPESCVSVEKDIDIPVARYKSCKVYAYDAISKKFVFLNVSGFEATIYQHEIDHMNGILHTDRLVNCVRGTKE